MMNPTLVGAQGDLFDGVESVDSRASPAPSVLHQSTAGFSPGRFDELANCTTELVDNFASVVEKVAATQPSDVRHKIAQGDLCDVASNLCQQVEQLLENNDATQAVFGDGSRVRRISDALQSGTPSLTEFRRDSQVQRLNGHLETIRTRLGDPKTNPIMPSPRDPLPVAPAEGRPIVRKSCPAEFIPPVQGTENQDGTWAAAGSTGTQDTNVTLAAVMSTLMPPLGQGAEDSDRTPTGSEATTTSADAQSDGQSTPTLPPERQTQRARRPSSPEGSSPTHQPHPGLPPAPPGCTLRRRRCLPPSAWTHRPQSRPQNRRRVSCTAVDSAFPVQVSQWKESHLALADLSRMADQSRPVRLCAWDGCGKVYTNLVEAISDVEGYRRNPAVEEVKLQWMWADHPPFFDECRRCFSWRWSTWQSSSNTVADMNSYTATNTNRPVRLVAQSFKICGSVTDAISFLEGIQDEYHGESLHE